MLNVRSLSLNAVPGVAKGLAIVRGFGRSLFPLLGMGGPSLDSQISDMRVEAIDQGAVRIRWSYSGSSSVVLYRSTDNLTYTVVDTIALGTTSYDDTELADKTRYYYKLSDDGGMTFSAVVNVTTYVNQSNIVNVSTLTGRRTKQAYTTQKDFNELVLALEQEENVKSVQSTPCDVCVINGSIIIDCTSGCEWFRAILDEDINSISILGCDGCPNIQFIIPPESIFGICGWPVGCGYSGDECFEAPIDGGSGGRTATTDGSTGGGYGDPPGGGGGGGCPCVRAERGLYIQCCETSCVLDCDGNSEASVAACNGIPPYVWTKTGAITLSSDIGRSITITNALAKNPSVSGIAACALPRISVTYLLVSANCFTAFPGSRYDIAFTVAGTPYSCMGVAFGSPIDLDAKGSVTLTLDGGNDCDDLPCHKVSAISTMVSEPGPRDGSDVSLRIQFTPFGGGASFDETFTISQSQDGTVVHGADFMDVRTAAMIADGCSGCEDCSDEPATVTVTDTADVSVTEIIIA